MTYLFDLDGTLVDSNGIWVEVDRTFLARRGLPYTQEYRDGIAHTIFTKGAAFTKAYFQLPDSCEAIMAEWMALAQSAYAGTVPLKPGVRTFLEQCRQRKIPMAIVTSSVPEHCRAVLAQHQLAGYFQCIVFAQELHIDKSTPHFFHEAARRCGVTTAECLLFDDSIAACRGGREAGVTVIGVADAVFAHASEDMKALCHRYITGFEGLDPAFWQA